MTLAILFSKISISSEFVRFNDDISWDICPKKTGD